MSASTYAAWYESPLGKILLASDGCSLTGLWFEKQKYFGSTLCEKPVYQDIAAFADVVKWLDLYFGGTDPGFLPPICPLGSLFRQNVWHVLLEIPRGQLISYGEISRVLGRTGSAQAVGGAVGHNPISIIIPCHRVIGADGRLTGYAGGLERERALLELEKAILPGDDRFANFP